MLDDEKIEEMKKMYIDSEFSIKIFKVKGKENITQIYKGTKQEIATCIASMIEQLIKSKMFSPNEMLDVINIAVKKFKKRKKRGAINNVN